jgi:hypothetical protein
MELGHLLTRSGLPHPEVSSKVYHDSFCQLGTSVSLPWVIYFDTSYIHVVSTFSCIPLICAKTTKLKEEGNGKEPETDGNKKIIFTQGSGDCY